MTEEKEQLSCMQEDEAETTEGCGDVVVIDSPGQLMSFLMDILEFGDNVESEEMLYNNNSYRILFSVLQKIPLITIAIENKYVDRVFRDSFYMHFSCKHGEYERFCKRLFLFEGNVFENTETVSFSELDVKKLQKNFIGTVVIRPLKEGKIGRTLISPYYMVGTENVYMRFAKYNATLYGMRFHVNAFPFSMQDGETTTCAEITILNLMDYFSKRYPEYKSILPSEIALIAEKNGYERNLPTRGLGYPVITKTFSEMGFSPRLYNSNLFVDMSQFKRVMHYYIESGIPVAVGVKVDDKTRHSIICMGHGKINYDKIGMKLYAVYDAIIDNYIWLIDSADLCESYIIMDDGQAPYENCKWTTVVKEGHAEEQYMLDKYEPDMLMVPLYKRMFLEAQDAYDICTSALASSKVGIQKFYPELGTREKPIIIRLFMCSSRNYKQRRIENLGEENREIRERYSTLLLPRFIWVCELYSNTSYCKGQAIGEIVIDATASPYDGIKSVLLFHYPSYILVCKKHMCNLKRLFDEDEEFEHVHNWEPFAGYDHNLFSPEDIKKCV